MTNRKDWLPSCSTSWTVPGADLYRSLSDVGFHHVELCGKTQAFWEDLDFFRHPEKAVAQMREYAITPSSIHLPFSPSSQMDPTDPDGAIRDAIVQLDGALLRAAAGVGIPIAVIHPSCEPYRGA